MNTQYTPGPWWWEDWDQDDGPNTRSLVARPETRANPSTSFPDLPNRILCIEDECTPENKVLIAAAPDLLAALDALGAFTRDLLRIVTPEQIKQARLTARMLKVNDQTFNALAKARGE